MSAWVEPASFTEPDLDACDNCNDNDCDNCGTGCCDTTHTPETETP